MAFEPGSLFKPNSDLNVRVLEGEAVLLNIRSGAYFSLNKVGTYIWQLYAEDRTLADVVSAVCARFAVEPQRADQDVRALTERLVARGLLIPV